MEDHLLLSVGGNEYYNTRSSTAIVTAHTECPGLTPPQYRDLLLQESSLGSEGGEELAFRSMKVRISVLPKTFRFCLHGCRSNHVLCGL